ncbi:exodeoxyribonuclease V subunit beta [Ramlibacter humi]|uniref:RecBCD enzyme subunit RecB n=1 Tax=Ramlibacter humi TaxID=2530451 RepID=A0A4Z0BGJ4_9BURK|nr:exodeoxyribonuclease V subunit beta [Ramlibacter humi]TFY97573.1 exodeoxyribonuclease V subunit beta [Ramlibacter humi]
MSLQPLDVFRVPLTGVRLVEASAGTGKTWNICGLYLRLLLEEGLDVDNVLVVTFTNAATAELKERIRGRLAEVLQVMQGRGPQSGDPFAHDLLRALDQRGIERAASAQRIESAIRQFDEASIFTIHGFAKRALDDAPLAAAVPLRQDLLEDDSELRQEAANDFWRRDIASGNTPAAVVRWMALQGDSPARLAELLRRHSGKPTAHVLWPESLDGAPVPDASVYAAAFGRARDLWLAERGEVIRCVAGSMESLSAVSYSEASLEQAVLQWDTVFASADPLGRPASGGKGLEKLKLLTAGSYRAKAKAKKSCLQHAFFDAAQEVLDEWQALQPALALGRLQVLRRFVETVPAELRERKRRRRLVAFDDMLANLDQRLRDPQGGDALAQALHERFPAALIDEFQDTDPLQFSVFDRVYGGRGRLFLVGDPKQAIYSFRNADLHTYLAAARGTDEQYSLAENQRSTGPLIDAMNALFGANPRAFMLDGLGYEPVRLGAKPRPVFEDRTGEQRAALHLWQLPAAEPKTKGEAQRLATQASAAEIARLLAAGQAGEATLQGRPIEARDIAVLVRSHREGSEMRAALAALGVGSVELAQASVFGTPDAEEIERLLAAVLEPAREGLLRAALATELLGLDASDLEAVTADEVRVSEFAQLFRGWRRLWVEQGVGPMLREVAASQSLAGRMLARGDGERRLTNFRHLSEALHEAAGAHPGPEALLRWLRRQRSEGRGESAQVRLESDRNLVQIVTIHKSKGLEYPVVFCPYLWNGRLLGGPARQPLGREYHDDGGRFVIDYRELEDPELAQVKSRMDLEAAAERLRLLYVALTRAVHRCYMVVGPYLMNKSASESHCNPLNWLAAGAGLAPLEWRQRKHEPQAIVHAWSALAANHPPAIRLEPLPETAGTPVALPRLAPESIEALAPPARIPWGWQLASYSSLAQGARVTDEAPAADHDARADDTTPMRATARDVEPGDILHFERGARAGETMHAVFERIEFGDTSTWPKRIEEAVRARPPAAMDAGVAATMLSRMARDVMATPLPGGIVLSGVRRRLVELEFALTASSLSASKLQAVLREHGYPAIAIGQPVLRGYLRGFIDLVFEHQGRMHVLDWKSSHLGWAPADYGPEPLARHMREAGYHLQYLLYTVAVHRWLRARKAGYDYERHFGGVLYLFVRGVRPGWVLEDGTPAGVFHDRPPKALVDALDAVLDGKEAA